jgi:hypothetical protein
MYKAHFGCHGYYFAEKRAYCTWKRSKKAAYHLHIMELELRRELFTVRLEKSMLANAMK